MSMVELPSREDLRRAIRSWWSGGGTAEKIVDVLRRGGANLEEARRLADRMTEVAEWKRFVTDENIEEQLELVRAAQAGTLRNARPRIEKIFDPFKCHFSDGVRCPNCGEVHGRLIGT